MILEWVGNEVLCLEVGSISSGEEVSVTLVLLFYPKFQNTVSGHIFREQNYKRAICVNIKIAVHISAEDGLQNWIMHICLNNSQLFMILFTATVQLRE